MARIYCDIGCDIPISPLQTRWRQEHRNGRRHIFYSYVGVGGCPPNSSQFRVCAFVPRQRAVNLARHSRCPLLLAAPHAKQQNSSPCPALLRNRCRCGVFSHRGPYQPFIGRPVCRCDLVEWPVCPRLLALRNCNRSGRCIPTAYRIGDALLLRLLKSGRAYRRGHS